MGLADAAGASMKTEQIDDASEELKPGDIVGLRRTWKSEIALYDYDNVKGFSCFGFIPKRKTALVISLKMLAGPPKPSVTYSMALVVTGGSVGWVETKCCSRITDEGF